MNYRDFSRYGILNFLSKCEHSNCTCVAERNIQGYLAREACCARNDVSLHLAHLRTSRFTHYPTSMNIAGFSLSNWMTYGFSFLGGSISWRFPIAFQLAFSVILLATVPWLPESPRWLLAHGYEEEGVEVLVALHGEGATTMDDHILYQKEEILDAVRLEKQTASSWKDVVRGSNGTTGMAQRLILGAGTSYESSFYHARFLRPD